MKINYNKKRLVAFLDVMGFKKLLSPTEENLKALNSYYETLNEIRGADKNSSYGSEVIVDTMAVSDSIVISIQISEKWSQDELFKNTGIFLSQLAIIQASLALEGIWTRGSVTIGDLYMDSAQSILVGQAFVDAYNLEQKANYPRIIIDPRFLKLFDLSAPLLCKKLKADGVPILRFNAVDTIDYASDDYMQIDWFGYILDSSRDSDQESLVEDERGLEIFFDDLTKRQYESADIFLKSQKLLGYLKRSFWESFLVNNRKKNSVYNYSYERISRLTGLKSSY